MACFWYQLLDSSIWKIKLSRLSRLVRYRLFRLNTHYQSLSWSNSVWPWILSDLQFKRHSHITLKKNLHQNFQTIQNEFQRMATTEWGMLYSMIQISPNLQFHSKTYTWLEKGSNRPDVSLTVAAKTMNKMCLRARDSAQSFRARMQEITSH